MMLAGGTIKRVHVNQFVIRANRRTGANEPPISIQTSRGVHRARTVEIDGPSRLVYAPEHPLPCGARLWVETRAPITYV